MSCESVNLKLIGNTLNSHPCVLPSGHENRCRCSHGETWVRLEEALRQRGWRIFGKGLVQRIDA